MSFGEEKQYGMRDKVRVRDAGVGHVVKVGGVALLTIYTIRIDDPEGSGIMIDARVVCVPADMELIEKATEVVE